MLILILISAGLVGLATALAIGQDSASAPASGVRVARVGGVARVAPAGPVARVARVARVAPAADQRGITLQTLIVTAVLVLMAVAAGVVIVAITNSASDDLERANAGIESQCNEVEVFDPILAARGEEGGAGGTDADTVKGSDEGCIPVCAFEGNGVAADATTIQSNEIVFRRNYDETLAQATAKTMGASDKMVFRNSRTLAVADADTNDVSASFSGDLAGGAEVRAIPSRDVCGVYDSEGRLIWPA